MQPQQAVLRRMNVEMSAPIVDYMIAVFKAPDTPQTLVNECVKNARLTDAERKELETKIATTRK